MKFDYFDSLEGLIKDYEKLTSKKYSTTDKVTISIKGTVTFDFASGTRTFDVTTYNNTKSKQTKNLHQD